MDHQARPEQLQATWHHHTSDPCHIQGMACWVVTRVPWEPPAIFYAICDLSAPGGWRDEDRWTNARDEVLFWWPLPKPALPADVCHLGAQRDTYEIPPAVSVPPPHPQVLTEVLAHPETFVTEEHEDCVMLKRPGGVGIIRTTAKSRRD